MPDDVPGHCLTSCGFEFSDSSSSAAPLASFSKHLEAIQQHEQSTPIHRIKSTYSYPTDQISSVDSAQMTEFSDLGKHCSDQLCRQQDFLPFTCADCSRVFCRDHRSSHACSVDRSLQACVCACLAVIVFAGALPSIENKFCKHEALLSSCQSRLAFILTRQFACVARCCMCRTQCHSARFARNSFTFEPTRIQTQWYVHTFVCVCVCVSMYIMCSRRNISCMITRRWMRT